MRKCPPESHPHPPNPTFKPSRNPIEIISSAFLLVLDYVEEIFQTFLGASSDALKGAVAKLKELTPLPMNSMLQRESKTDAVKKKTDRSKKVVVPPTTPGKKAHIQLFHLFWGKGLAWETSSSMLYTDFKATFTSLPPPGYLQKAGLPYFVPTLSQKYSETTHISLQTCFNYATTSAMEGNSKYM